MCTISTPFILGLQDLQWSPICNLFPVDFDATSPYNEI